MPRQSIKCSVSTCKYHTQNGKCSQNSIQVAPDATSSRVNTGDQSMCSSFESQDGR